MTAALPRLAAAEILASVEAGRTLEHGLRAAATFDALSGRDRAFARAIVGAALRRLGGLDAILARAMDRPLPESATLPRALLRVGAVELLVLETPPHAAVSQTVSAMRRVAPGLAGLANAVLRRIDREGRAPFAALPPGTDLPDWLFVRWRAAFGDAGAAAIAKACRDEPPMDLTARADPEVWAKRLSGVLTPTGSVRLPHGHPPVRDLDGFADGAWWVQDAAAALPARMLGDVAGLRVLDLCAAPGGKTLQLAAMGAAVTALDIDAERLERLQDNLARTGLTAEIVAADALAWRPDAPFDAVLLDAPCTATGTLRRRPDAAWLRRPGDIAALARTQRALLEAALRFVRPGGLVVYAVCSLEPEEGPAIVAQALEAGQAIREPCPAPSDLLDAASDLRTTPDLWPALGGLDGFYAARLRAP